MNSFESGEISSHYADCWGKYSVCTWKHGPTHELDDNFCVLKFPPRPARELWTYATVFMSEPSNSNGIEIHLFSLVENDSLVELLTIIAHYHRNGAALNINHTVNFGRPWLPSSCCGYGLLSLPYLDGPRIETAANIEVKSRFLWLIPITEAEKEFKSLYGVESLEERFEEANFNYVDPHRPSVV